MVILNIIAQLEAGVVVVVSFVYQSGKQVEAFGAGDDIRSILAAIAAAPELCDVGAPSGAVDTVAR